MECSRLTSTLGEGALLDGNEYEATVKATTYCNFNTLSRSKFQEIIEQHPEYKEELLQSLQVASRRRGSLLKRNRDNEGMRKDMLRGKSGVFSIGGNDTLEILHANEKTMMGDTKKEEMTKNSVKVVPVTSRKGDSSLRQADKPSDPIESMETIEEQRLRLLNNGSTIPKPPMKKPGESTMAGTSKFGRANASWQS